MGRRELMESLPLPIFAGVRFFFFGVSLVFVALFPTWRVVKQGEITWNFLCC